VVRKARGKGLFEAGFSAQIWQKGRVLRQKNDFFRRFSEAKSHDVGNFGAEIFPQALISKGLEIICKV
jgi:hypothetical protein